MTTLAHTPDALAAAIVRPVRHPDGSRTPLTHVAWRKQPAAADHHVWLYVDAARHAVITDAAQTQAWLSLDPNAAQTIELFAVPAQVSRDTLASSEMSNATRFRAADSLVRLRIDRPASLPIGAQVGYALDAQPRADAPLFDPAIARGGFGSLFGLGAFGVDAAAAIGLGLGQLGIAPLDVDTPPMVLTEDAPDLPDTPTLTINFTDPQGHPLTPAIDISAQVTRRPPPIANLRLTPDQQLTWTA
ncbi:MAG: hypothetical protein AAF823_10465 [Planctomycetota bacterium]